MKRIIIRFQSRVIPSLLIFFVISVKTIAQNINTDISACSDILKILNIMREGGTFNEVSLMLDSVLQTKPFQVMFKHYNRSWRPNHLPLIVFKNMILSLKFDNTYNKGDNTRADQMLQFWRKYYDDLPLFQKNLDQLRKSNLEQSINDGVAYAQSWLPSEWKIPDFSFYIIPNGGSPAFSIESNQGYDFFQLPRDSLGNIMLNELISTISHESHHLGIRTIYPEKLSRSDSIAYEFLSLFLAEGTAVKCVNNYPGGCVPAIDKSKNSDIFKDAIKIEWQKYTLKESELFLLFTTTFEKAYSGKLSRKELQDEMQNFWLNGYISPVYFIGSELFGAIYIGGGKENLFKAMVDLRQVPLLYNDAIKNQPRLIGNCFVFPDSIVQHSLRIGNKQ